MFERGERGTHTPKSPKASHVFELVLKNGLVIRLQAYDSLARDEWVRRLRDLSKYWKLRMIADVAALKAVRRENLKRLEIDVEFESELGQLGQKWELSRAIASAELFNTCGISCCRAITVRSLAYDLECTDSDVDVRALVL